MAGGISIRRFSNAVPVFRPDVSPDGAFHKFFLSVVKHHATIIAQNCEL